MMMFSWPLHRNETQVVDEITELMVFLSADTNLRDVILTMTTESRLAPFQHWKQRPSVKLTVS